MCKEDTSRRSGEVAKIVQQSFSFDGEKVEGWSLMRQQLRLRNLQCNVTTLRLEIAVRIPPPPSTPMQYFYSLTAEIMFFHSYHGNYLVHFSSENSHHRTRRKDDQAPDLGYCWTGAFPHNHFILLQRCPRYYRCLRCY